MSKLALVFLVLFARFAHAQFDYSARVKQLVGPLGEEKKLLELAHQQTPAMYAELEKLIGIPSISKDVAHQPDMHRVTIAVANFFRQAVGAKNVRAIQLETGNPYIVVESEKLDPTKPTVLFYAHSDVMPPNGEWSVTEPFTALHKNGRIYGRGAGDNKGGIVLIGAILKAFLSSGMELPFNFRLLVDAEEEIGSPTFPKLVALHPEIFHPVDMVIIPDGVNLKEEVPTITTSLRGLLRLKVKLTASDRASHSGLFGGPYPDPRMAATLLTSDLVDRGTGGIAIPSLYESLFPPTPAEVQTLARLRGEVENFRTQTGLLESAHVLASPRMPLSAQIAREPALSVVSIEGAQNNPTAIQPYAEVELAVRIPPGLDPTKARDAILDFYRRKSAALWGHHVDISDFPGGSSPWIADAEHPAIQLIGEGLYRGFGGGEPTMYMGAGGTVGLMKIMDVATHGAPAALLGIDDPDTALHGPNECLHKATFTGDRDGLIRSLFSLRGARRAAGP